MVDLIGYDSWFRQERNVGAPEHLQPPPKTESALQWQLIFTIQFLVSAERYELAMNHVNGIYVYGLLIDTYSQCIPIPYKIF